jgi:hypothetical protein
VGGSRPGSEEGWLGFVEESVGPVFVEVCFGVVLTVVCGVELTGVVVWVGVAVEVVVGVDVATTGVDVLVAVLVLWCFARRRAAARRRRTAAA